MPTPFERINAPPSFARTLAAPREAAAGTPARRSLGEGGRALAEDKLSEGAKKALLAGGASAAELRAANQRLQELRLVCETAIARHVRQVSALMSPQDGQRYLALVLPKIADFDHQAAPDLHLNHTP